MRDEELRRQAKIAFLLANSMKPPEGSRLDAATFGEDLAQKRSELDALSRADPREFDARLLDGEFQSRLYCFNGSVWREEMIHLDGCWVFPGMGGLDGLMGKVPDVARMLSGGVFRDSESARRIREMGQVIDQIVDSLHLILVASAAHPLCPYLPRVRTGHYTIDDGSHRAVATWLNDPHRRARAFVARYQA